jgi:hypothetical protein
MIKRRRSLAAGICLAISGCLGTIGFLPLAGQPAEAGSGAVVGLHSGPGESPAAAIADVVQRVALARYSGVYAGEVLVDHGSRVVVYLTRPGRAAEAVITAGVQRGVVRFARAPRSLAFLNRLHKRVTADQPRLGRRGINLVRWGPDFITGRENITVQHLTAAKKAVLDGLFGAANLTLSTTTNSVAGIAVSRSHDSPPWNGGDYIINDPATGICTSGFGAHSGSTEYLITAGHCFGVNELVVNGSPRLTGVYTGVGTLKTRGSYGKKNGIDS